MQLYRHDPNYTGSIQDQYAVIQARPQLHHTHNLKLPVVAEGVETGQQMEFLQSQLCEEAQGVVFSAPLPAAQIEAYLRSHTAVVVAANPVVRH